MNSSRQFVGERAGESPVKSQKAFDIPADRIEGLVKDGHALVSRLCDVSERLLGAEPQAGATNTQECGQVESGPVLGGVAGDYMNLAEEAGLLIERLRYVVLRLERL